MESTGAGTVPAAADDGGGVTDLLWNGRALAPSRVASLFIAASLLLLGVGVGLNYVLTDGAWDTRRDTVQSAFGEGPTYFTSSPYDVAGLSILLASLVALGAGFVAAWKPTLRLGPTPFATYLIGTLVFAGVWYATASPIALVLAAVGGVLVLVWALAAWIGAGPRMHLVRAAGFVLFGLYWATQAMRLYRAEEGDFVNGLFAAFAVFFFDYFAYQEVLSVQRGEDPRALHWLAGASFLTTGVYLATHKLQPIAEWLMLRVSEQTTWLLQFFNQGVVRGGGVPDGTMIEYPVDDPHLAFPIQIILACTAVQSIMIFVGGILAVRPPRLGDGVSGRATIFPKLLPTYDQRRFFALLLTVPLIYTLNLFRNVIIIRLSADGHPPYFIDHPGATSLVCQLTPRGGCGPAEAAFWFSHNVIGKGGSLVALVIIAYMVFQILPELYDSIVGLLDLKDRQGPLERWFGVRPRKGTGGAPRTQPAPAAPASATRSEPTEAQP